MLSRFSPILVVDDSSTMRRIVCGMLSSLGWMNIHEASDAQSALTFLNNKRFGLVISDWNMAPISGLELLSKIRQSSLLGTLPFIMMTAHAVKFSALARDNGCSYYLIKPFKPEALAAKIKSVTSGAIA